jgi:hypothetical protein
MGLGVMTYESWNEAVERLINKYRTIVGNGGDKEANLEEAIREFKHLGIDRGMAERWLTSQPIVKEKS